MHWKDWDCNTQRNYSCPWRTVGTFTGEYTDWSPQSVHSKALSATLKYFMTCDKSQTKANSAATELHFLTRFDLFDDWFAVTVPHLSDVQQGVRVPIVGWPVVHKDPGATAATVHHDPIIQSRVEDVSGLHGLCNGEVPGWENAETLWGTLYFKRSMRMNGSCTWPHGNIHTHSSTTN